MTKEKWSKEELLEVERYLKTTITLPTLFARIFKINPERTYEAVAHKVRRIRDGEKYKETAMSTLRVGYLDIEATDLETPPGFILSWYIKKAGKNEYKYGIITKKEIFNEDFDKRIVKELLLAIQNDFDILYTHYGSDWRFDVPYIRTRAIIHGLEDLLPRRMEKIIRDTWPIARCKLRLPNNRLDTIGDALGVATKKTPLSLNTWQKAMVGNKEALEYVRQHNKRDVDLLEEVHKKLGLIEVASNHGM